SDRVAVMSDGVIQQIGRGAEVYNNPATSFVASFVGENNAFFGTVTRAADGQAELDTVFGPMRGRNNQGLKVGDKAVLFIRPEALRLANGSGTNDCTLESDVMTNELEGAMVHLRLARSEGGKPITLSLTNDGKTIAAEPGTRVRAAFDPARAVALPHGPLADE
ncbi:MAG: TOBE domain-containing protein, partial [Dongiaceae bacterium]